MDVDERRASAPQVNLLGRREKERRRTGLPPQLRLVAVTLVAIASWSIAFGAVAMLLGWHPRLPLGP